MYNGKTYSGVPLILEVYSNVNCITNEDGNPQVVWSSFMGEMPYHSALRNKHV